MNCRNTTPIDARSITRVMRSFVHAQAWIGVALQHCPGEGPGGPA